MHIDRGDVGAHQRPGDSDAALSQLRGGLAKEQAQLQWGGTAEAIDQAHHLIAAAQVQGGHDLFQDLVHNGARTIYLLGVRARLAVNAHAHLHLAGFQIEGFAAGSRHEAGAQRHGHAAGILRGTLAQLSDCVHVIAAVGGGTCDLFHQDGRAGTAAAGAVLVAIGGNIIGHQHRAGIYRLGGVAGDGEIHDVTGVVLHHVDYSPALVSPLGGLADLDRVRGGKEQSRAGRCEHALADKPGMHRFVTGTATGNHRHCRITVRGAQRRGAANEANVVPASIGVVGDEPGKGIRKESILAIAECGVVHTPTLVMFLT